MSAPDVIAAYGAVLATVLAVVQLAQWRQSRRFLSVKYIEFFENQDSCIEAVISNRGQHPVHLDFVAAGYSIRWMRKPWARDCLNLRSMSRIDAYREDGAILKEVVDGEVLEPGALLRVGMRKSDFEQMNRDGCPPNGFSLRPCIWIEHSQSDVEICKVITWTA